MTKNSKKIFFIIFFILTIISFGLFAYIVHKTYDKDTCLKELLLDKDDTILKAFFSPDDNIKEILINLIECEKKAIKTTIFTLTQREITQALIDAYDRGICIECIADRGYGSDKYSKIPRLANNNIPIWIYQSDDKNGSLMHNKFIIFESNILDKSILWTGSYNLTNRASDSNQENIIILDDKQILDRYEKQFKILKSRSLMISGNINTDYKNTYNQPKLTKKYNGNIEATINQVIKWLLKMAKDIKTLIRPT